MRWERPDAQFGARYALGVHASVVGNQLRSLLGLAFVALRAAWAVLMQESSHCARGVTTGCGAAWGVRRAK
jgi:hypothetical protein